MAVMFQRHPGPHRRYTLRGVLFFKKIFSKPLAREKNIF